VLNITELLDEIKASPFEEIVVRAPHTGVVEFVQDKPGIKVLGPGGAWKEKPGTLLAHLVREGNTKPIHALQKGVVERIEQDLAGKFVQAGTPLLHIRHFLSKEEVLDRLLHGPSIFSSRPWTSRSSPRAASPWRCAPDRSCSLSPG